ncbi:hypothetical protein [Methylobacterium marchantiae]|uniref:Uncharacterized protein n=1 Tax=Methylobacterium marchantiae TaxID=600331 RepID=A0ABW3X4B7_9HYPH
MSTRSDLRATSLRATSFDPYGEPVCDDRSVAMVQGDRRARNAAIAVFWTLALTLIAGRVYFSDQSVGQTIILAQAQIASLVGAIR